jgi:predicted RNase H-like HicB family nuclease
MCYHAYGESRCAVQIPREEAVMLRQFKIVVEKHPDGYVAYPLGLKGVVVGQGDTYEEALADVKSAIAFHVETFGRDVLEADTSASEAFIAEVGVAV